MRCATCGENLLHGEDRCPTCGAVIVRRPVPTPHVRGVRQCLRCGYRGDGIPYFRKPLHAVLLAAVSFPTFGLGGLVYYASHRRNLVCPDCGHGWEHARRPGEVATVESPPPPAPSRAARPPSRSLTGPLPPSGIGRRVVGVGLGVVALLSIVAGVADGFVPEAVVMGSIFGMGGSGMFLWGWRALQKRRRAVMQGLGRRVLQLASDRGGVLTVTEVAAELDLSLEAAEKVMIGMDDGFRVRSDISDEGVLYYEFPELRHQQRLQPGKEA